MKEFVTIQYNDHSCEEYICDSLCISNNFICIQQGMYSININISNIKKIIDLDHRFKDQDQFMAELEIENDKRKKYQEYLAEIKKIKDLASKTLK